MGVQFSADSRRYQVCSVPAGAQGGLCRMSAVKDRIEPLQHVLDPSIQDELGKYPGKWVALTRSAVIAVGDNVASVRAEATDKGILSPILFKVPEPGTVLIL